MTSVRHEAIGIGLPLKRFSIAMSYSGLVKHVDDVNIKERPNVAGRIRLFINSCFVSVWIHNFVGLSSGFSGIFSPTETESLT